MDFITADRMFRAEQIADLAGSEDGRRYLKLRSLSRKDHLLRLFANQGQTPEATSAKRLFKEAYEAEIAEVIVNDLIAAIDIEQRTERIQQRNNLVNELYKLQAFDWGGLHQNSLEKTIVDNYIKKIWTYDILEQKIDGELHNSLRGYVLCSWYNHWTSILIEDIFRDHPVVLPAIGQVKKIDFFIKNVPFDLKVTYLPEGFVVEKRRRAGLRPELTLLRQCARALQIGFDQDLPAGKQLEDLWNKIDDVPASTAVELMVELKAYRRSIVDGIVNDEIDLITWLYENQGVRRFDASNRLFVVLIDTQNYFGSWKLKRAFSLLNEKISGYLGDLGDSVGRELEFSWEGERFRATSDLIVIRKPES